LRVLITGSSGQIGTNLALRLQAAGHEVFGVDKRANTWTDQFEYAVQDLLTGTAEGMARAWPKSDLVVHMAAHAKVHELVGQPHRALENVTMTFNVLEYCRAQRLPIVFGSSRETYGNLPQTAEGVSEEMANFMTSASPYSASKLAGEAFVYSYARCYNLPYIVFRFSNVYGCYDDDIERMERVIPLFIRKIRRGEPVVVYGRDKLLDFTYVDDCVAGVISGIVALAEKRVQNETINLAYGKGSTLVELVQLIGRALNVEPDMHIGPTLVGEVTHYVANIGKACRLLGYAPKVPLSEGIPLAIAWQEAFHKELKVD
jgi:UDP-glucuronate 4-epimerase